MLLLHLIPSAPQLVHWPWRWLGLLPIAGGVALAIAGEHAFERAGTAVLPFGEPSALVTAGPFAFARNPCPCAWCYAQSAEHSHVQPANP